MLSVSSLAIISLIIMVLILLAMIVFLLVTLSQQQMRYRDQVDQLEVSQQRELNRLQNLLSQETTKNQTLLNIILSGDIRTFHQMQGATATSLMPSSPIADEYIRRDDSYEAALTRSGEQELIDDEHRAIFADLGLDDGTANDRT
jgi:hypothetical protein